MKVRLSTMEDDTFVVECEFPMGADPTGPQADFVTQLIETAMPDTALVSGYVPTPGRLDTRFLSVPVDVSSAAEWAGHTVDVIASLHGVERDEALRALADELNRRGVTTERELRIKGGRWKGQVEEDSEYDDEAPSPSPDPISSPGPVRGEVEEIDDAPVLTPDEANALLGDALVSTPPRAAMDIDEDDQRVTPAVMARRPVPGKP